ncbi:hypothetical protein PSECIP111951_02283 [Pseudoalteromonas holothuriae]|uniref:DUF3466 family protein n=1 Tax=Pseudoalteromonas holothuriae TaxID=2963714 RepID=A0A9W4QZ55_9GAMM|nr:MULTISPECIES: DUF3466 family protein [unclassified Pseudoalteromonas]CAH9060442.1 hypothetical protein PSECIP111951_02283 [Pseudoalteromonas sp. CIP111951]CAH9060618.1 hypothetical protein PSECIP111854_02643 [Pseudoalteromonas sp. CIP111854]
MKHTFLAVSILAGLSSQALAATYQLTELPRYEGAKYTFISDVNDNGQIIGAATSLFNLPIDVSYIDFDDATIKNAYDQAKRSYEQIDEEISFTLEDIKNGAAATNADANRFMLSFLGARANSAEYQKLQDRIALDIDAISAQEHVLFDVENSDTNGLTRSTSNYLTAISEDGVMVGWGSAPFSKTTFTPEGQSDEETFFIRDWSSRGVVITPQGEKVILEPEFTEHGGYSIATDIKKLDNGGYVVVGQSSVGIPENRQKNYDDNCDSKDEPLQVCRWLQQVSSRQFYDLRAFKWQLDESFNVISTTNLGLGLTPKDDENDAFVSAALAVNKAGVTVGYSPYRGEEDGSVAYPFNIAGYFEDGKLVPFKELENRAATGKATDINNNNIAIGYMGRRVGNGSILDQYGFYYDLNTKEYTQMPYFFKGSSTITTDINDAGYIIGQAEIEKNSSNRRREGFIYKVGDEKLLNINDLLPCKDDSGNNYPYTVAEAIKITESNHIYAIATKTVERRDRLGNIEKDSNGEIEYESVTLPVLLTPTPQGQIEDCAPPEAETYERQSGSALLLSLLVMPFAWLRRKKLKLLVR